MRVTCGEEQPLPGVAEGKADMIMVLAEPAHYKAHLPRNFGWRGLEDPFLAGLRLAAGGESHPHHLNPQEGP